MTNPDTKPKPLRTVTATVAGHSLHNGKPFTQLDIPAWGSKFPIPLYGISEQAQTELPLGETLDVVLQADRQKSDTDGSKPWQFFWSFVRVAGPDDAPTKPPAQGPEPSRDPGTDLPPDLPAESEGGTPGSRLGHVPQPRQAPSAPRVDTDLAIRRAVALKAAVDFAGAFEGLNEGDVLATAQQFEEWLARE